MMNEQPKRQGISRRDLLASAGAANPLQPRPAGGGRNDGP